MLLFKVSSITDIKSINGIIFPDAKVCVDVPDIAGTNKTVRAEFGQVVYRSNESHIFPDGGVVRVVHCSCKKEWSTVVGMKGEYQGLRF